MYVCLYAYTYTHIDIAPYINISLIPQVHARYRSPPTHTQSLTHSLQPLTYACACVCAFVCMRVFVVLVMLSVYGVLCVSVYPVCVCVCVSYPVCVCMLRSTTYMNRDTSTPNMKHA